MNGPSHSTMKDTSNMLFSGISICFTNHKGGARRGVNRPFPCLPLMICFLLLFGGQPVLIKSFVTPENHFNLLRERCTTTCNRLGVQSRDKKENYFDQSSFWEYHYDGIDRLGGNNLNLNLDLDHDHPSSRSGSLFDVSSPVEATLPDTRPIPPEWVEEEHLLNNATTTNTATSGTGTTSNHTLSDYQHQQQEEAKLRSKKKSPLFSSSYKTNAPFPSTQHQRNAKTSSSKSTTKHTPAANKTVAIQPKPKPTTRRIELEEEDSLEQVAADITTVLKTLKPYGQDPSLPKLFRNINMPSFTNIWSQKDWDLHTSRWRHLKYLWSIPTSRLLRRLAPQLVILILWSCIACWMCCKEFEGILSRAVLPLTPLGLVSTFIAGLLTLRSNQGLSRLNEGRLAFGKVVLYTRDMAQLITTVVYPRNPQLGLLAARHTSLFGWLLLDFLRHYDEDYTRPLDPYQPSVCHEEDVVKVMLPYRHGRSGNTDNVSGNNSIRREETDDDDDPISRDAQYILDQRKKPVAICTRLRQIFAHLRLELTSSEQSRLDVCAQQLNKCITVCERIRASPIPPLYTAHAGRLLIFYLFFLPLALRGSSLLNNVGTILTTTVVGYAMLGLDEISHILEQPFRLMPLYHLSKNSMKDVADAVVCIPPSLPVEKEQSQRETTTATKEDAPINNDNYPPTSSRFPSYW